MYGAGSVCMCVCVFGRAFFRMLDGECVAEFDRLFPYVS